MENSPHWTEANKDHLMAEIKAVQAELQSFQLKQMQQQPGVKLGDSIPAGTPAVPGKPQKKLTTPSALETLVSILGLSSFERKIILMCAGVELDSGFASLVAGLQGNPDKELPSFSLAMAAFSDAHWSAISPERPLRFWRMIEIKHNTLLTRSPLKIDEQLLAFLTGLNCLDERFSEIVEPVSPGKALVPSHRELSDKILDSFNLYIKKSTSFPVVILNGKEDDKSGIAAHAAAGAGRSLFAISAFIIPAAKNELVEFIRLWDREAALNGYALLIDCTEMDTADKVSVINLQGVIENIHCPLFISTDRWLPKVRRPAITVDVLKPARSEQSSLWQESLGEHGFQLNGMLDKLVSQFNLDTGSIRNISAEMMNVLSSTGDKKESPGSFKEELWKICCAHSRPRIDQLAQRIKPVATWNDIVLPVTQKDILREIAIQVKNRKKVYDDWGFASASSRGLGISSLFTGESGTGKTMAAEVLANELQLDLYRIDLSQVVNKYIGETEKNLKQIFDAAEDGGAILLFDEADALFGKRSEVKDSHDRYSNIEVSYLLQRMEAYRGLAILTSNMKSALDKAFMRRIRFIVQFPFPGAVQRAEIWSKVFPADTPVDGLNLEKLARLDLPGGNIRNIALNAAFLAADENIPIGMKHIYKAARTEFSKLEKSVNFIESEPE